MDHIEAMKVFVRIAEQGGFSSAARALRISTAVATRHVAFLEKRLSTRLLHRNTRSVSLTDSGRVYLDRVKDILDELDGVEQMISASNLEPTGSLKIVAPVVFGLQALAPAMETYAARFPKVQLNVTLDDGHVDLVDDGFDVGIIIEREIRSTSIITRRLMSGRFMVCATPSYLKLHGTPQTLEELGCHPCLSIPAEDSGYTCMFVGPEGKTHFKAKNSVSSNNIEMLRQFALRDMGIAILPSYLVVNDFANGRLMPLMEDFQLPDVEVKVGYSSRRHLPAKVRTFVDHLVGQFSAHKPYLSNLEEVKPGSLGSRFPVIDMPLRRSASVRGVEATEQIG